MRLFKKLDELGLHKLDLHSCRIWGATESSRLGVARGVIKKVQRWTVILGLRGRQNKLWMF